MDTPNAIAISVISLPEAEILRQQSRTAVVIAHPYWLMTVNSFQPKMSIVLLPEPAGGEADCPLWESCISRLAGVADLIGTALSVLDGLDGETSRHWKFQIDQETGRVEDALALVHAADIQDGSSRRDYQELSGSAMALRGERHGAVRQFLEAAMENEDALARIVEMELLDQAVQQLLGEVQ